MNIDQLHNLIVRYFDAATTLDEEQQLKHELAHTRYSSPLIDEARAVLGFSFTATAPSTVRLSSLKRLRSHVSHIAVAASLVITIGIALSIYFQSSQTSHSSPSYAIVNGNLITDNETINEMMLQSLNMLSAANANMVANAQNSITDLINIHNSLSSNL